ncbi:hypothetical protein HPP92_004252 [Vanilla planifolia]|uniref:Uncharacterized protein n=1 Tax=Vanilla planifolia TaxID=51239 RepID=A0A835S405_VANPL|nr:hypothetical protein HPP92_004252 [Vanilla planifolia]
MAPRFYPSHRFCHTAIAAFGIAFLARSFLPSHSATLALYNRCAVPVWPGIQPSAGNPSSPAVASPPQPSLSIRLPFRLVRRVWGRQGCVFDDSGRGPLPPPAIAGFTPLRGHGAPSRHLAEITLCPPPRPRTYDVSLVDGWAIFISMRPFRGAGRCGAAGCVSDPNG